MKAINKFRGLVRSRTNTPTSLSPGPFPDPDRTPRASPGSKSITSQPPVESAYDTAAIAALIEERRKAIARGSSDGSKGHALSPLDSGPPPILGIGAGGRDDFASSGPSHSSSAGTVAESPSAVEFNVYDTAYAAEIERIKSQSKEKKGSRPTMFMTKLLEGVADKIEKDDGVVGEKGKESSAGDGSGTRNAAAGVIRDTAASIGTALDSTRTAVDNTRTATAGKSRKFADLVLQAAKGSGEKDAK